MNIPPLTEVPPPRSPQETALRKQAVAFEAAFLAEMLSHAGFGAVRDVGGGGAGEDAFASLLAREQADAFARQGGIGLADELYASLVRSAGGAGS